MGRRAAAGTSRRLKRRRIIERPRLFALLDESNARVRMLVAPAGYGKTTLAEQWVARESRRSAWYTARSSSKDVAGLALGVARSASAIFPGCDARLRQHLRAVPNPGEHVDVLAEILGEELEGWGSSDWLVLDDYQELAGALDAERFVAELLRTCPLRLLLGSRVRPVWATGRSILYGEILELNQVALAMDSREAAEMLTGRSAPSASGIVALAHGWPAVIALASVTSAEIGKEDVPESLYEFFAEEVFAALGDEVRTGLSTLAVAPVLDRELAETLIGSDRAEHVCATALDVGLLEERGDRLELHPLARSFLDEWAHQAGLEPADAATVTACLEHYRARGDWDAAFDVLVRNGPSADVEALLRDALDDLLETARLTTIETWCAAVPEATTGAESAVLAIARAEVALRQGRHGEAQAHAEAAATTQTEDRALVFRALSIAGRAAHLASREEDGLELYRRAEAAATTSVEQRDALWGQVMCLVELERDEARATLDQLREGVRMADTRDLVRAAANQLTFQLRMGNLDLTEADRAFEVLATISDPLTESAFQSVYASALALSARYPEALEVARALSSTALQYRLEFALPYALIAGAMAHAGLRNFDAAHRNLRQASQSVPTSRDAYASQLRFAVLLRVYGASGEHEMALTLRTPDLASALPAIRGEVVGSRALLLASVDRVDEAVEVVDDATLTTRAVELRVLGSAVRAIAAIKRRDPNLRPRVADLEHVAFTSGAVDLLVTAYRSCPELLPVLLKVSGQTGRVAALVRDVGDADLAAAIGEPLTAFENPLERLSKREREVYDLLCQGLSNRQIAQLLFISESTVKVHAHHVYDKLGTRSRRSLALRAALRQQRQATSATNAGDADTDS